MEYLDELTYSWKDRRLFYHPVAVFSLSSSKVEQQIRDYSPKT